MAPFPVPAIYSMESLNKDSPIRQVYPEDIYPNGDYYPSPYGRVRYWIVGPEEGRKVVLIHGIACPSIVWKDVQAELVSNGFRVLMYDVYGRGYTEAPRLTCDPSLCIVQLALLMQYIRWNVADVVGFSMGGAIAASFAAMFPHLIDKNVVMLSAAGLIDTKESQPDSGQLPVHLRELQSQHLPGFNDILESSRKDGLITGANWAYKKLGKMTDKRFLIVHVSCYTFAAPSNPEIPVQGTADNIVPYSEAFKIHKLVPQAQLVPIEGASHYVPLEEGSREKFTAALVKFLS
ncbi:uncharacterized protein PHACADRAFT_25221 [Phanerochaete carnosa HHB-10118-sp]|uniref:AB hydrolase-1 domain-containing protein n=1 Tax=Phanerochaete carnosa (strain HHB-10118-sp) TaxID=650164 RepID=K5WIA7_PHACS|nr:uncharacterized protein PHACADRAFT_25221 [Phanerochaete carnosa HHB-10118-sp]EKM59110.1 hypothetical protein PHACADRAFT_25221 [Phanerochaete carnosa HHB-10118-sp]